MNISFDYDTDAYQGARATYYMPAEPNEASCEVTKADVNNITINDTVDITNPEIIKKFEEWVMSDDCLITYYFEKRIEERILDEMD